MAGGDARRDAMRSPRSAPGSAIGNLHYLNYSDRPACRMTGMTRFATFWVEDGKIVAPVDVLRFDDTVYRMLGANLEALTAETELLLDAGTYGAQARRACGCPARWSRRWRSRCSAEYSTSQRTFEGLTYAASTSGRNALADGRNRG